MWDALSDWLNYLVERPLLFLALASIPFGVMGFWRQVFPGPRFVALMAIPAIASISQILAPEIGWYVLLLDGLILIAAIIDFWTVSAARNFSVQRNVGRIASIGKWQTVELELTYVGKRSCTVKLVEDLPQDFVAAPEFHDIRLEPSSRTTLHHRIRSLQRGLFQLQGIYLQVQSRLGLWRGYYFKPDRSEIHVYPDMRQIAEFDLLARTNRLSLLGLRVTRKVGKDNEFERLRDYSLDDNYRHIDWRTTARRQKLTVRDFQANQNQQILFLVDCGRMMTGHIESLSLLDYSLNAMLMMSYVALRQGDSVGLCLFSERVLNYVAPRSGVKQINRILHASFDQHPEFVESRYDEAFLHLQKNCRKRSLVVLLTNVIDEINASQIRRYLVSSSGRHLPLAVLLRDHSLFTPVGEYFAGGGRDARDAGDGLSPAETLKIFRAAAAADIINWRQQVISSLTRGGVLCLDVFPEQLTASLVNQYLEIKARHLL